MRFSFSNHDERDASQRQSTVTDLASKYHNEYAKISADLKAKKYESVELRR